MLINRRICGTLKQGDNNAKTSAKASGKRYLSHYAVNTENRPLCFSVFLVHPHNRQSMLRAVHVEIAFFSSHIKLASFSPIVAEEGELVECAKRITKNIEFLKRQTERNLTFYRKKSKIKSLLSKSYCEIANFSAHT